MIEVTAEITSTIVVVREKLAGALAAMNEHLGSEWPHLRAVFKDHGIQTTYDTETGDFLLGSYECPSDDAPRDEDAEDLLSRLAPFVTDGGEFEMTVTEMNDDGEFDDRVVGPYRFRNGKIYEVRATVTHEEVEL